MVTLYQAVRGILDTSKHSDEAARRILAMFGAQPADTDTPRATCVACGQPAAWCDHHRPEGDQ